MIEVINVDLGWAVSKSKLILALLPGIGSPPPVTEGKRTTALTHCEREIGSGRKVREGTSDYELGNSLLASASSGEGLGYQKDEQQKHGNTAQNSLSLGLGTKTTLHLGSHRISRSLNKSAAEPAQCGHGTMRLRIQGFEIR